MNCKYCNNDKKTRKEFEKRNFCPCCNGKRKVSFNRHVQFELGARVAWLNGNGGEALAYVMDQRCQSVINEVFKEFGKTRLPILKNYDGKYNADPVDVTYFYANQLKGEDCLSY